MPVRPPSLRAVAAFEVAARHQSFSKAAEELNLTHGAISHAIKGLETRLGSTLFERRARGVVLTEAGRVLAGKVRALLDARPNVSIEDVRGVVLPAMRHRCLLNFEGEAEGMSTDTILQNIVDTMPVDVAVGWGPMSDEGVLSGLNISQNNRFFFYRWENRPPIPSKDIAAHAANIHVISVNDEVAQTVRRLRRGEVVTMRGFLVNAARDGGWHWRSSLSRTDTGRGACELFYVQECRPGTVARVAAR